MQAPPPPDNVQYIYAYPPPQYIYMAPPPQGIYYPPPGAPVYIIPPAPPTQQQSVPLTSSTPLPTSAEYEMVQKARKNVEFQYMRRLEHDDLPIDEISKISLDDDQDGEANYKTRLCMTHSSAGKACDMGARCKFAHGLKELRSAEAPNRHQTNTKYKTKLCKNFARGGSGFCPYGLRCEFVHPTDKEFDHIPHYQRQMLRDKDQKDPEDYVVARHHPSRYAGSSSPQKVLLKSRNVAGSAMCLTQAGRGDFDFRRRRIHPTMPMRRRPANRWTSEEHLY